MLFHGKREGIFGVSGNTLYRNVTKGTGQAVSNYYPVFTLLN